MDKFTNKQLNRVLAFSGLTIFGLLILFELHEFITTFLGALIFYILFKKLMSHLVHKRHWKAPVAAVFIILISILLILIPVTVLIYMLYSKIVFVLNEPSSIIDLINMFDNKIFELTGLKIVTDENMSFLKTNVGNLIPSMLGQTFWIITSIVIMCFILYYMLINNEKLSEEMAALLPFDADNIHLFSQELESITLSNAIGVPLIAIAQGAIAGLAYWILGLPEPVFWGTITAFAGFIPFIGTAIVWVPASIFIIAIGNTWQGIVMLIFGVSVVVNFDNVALFMFEKKFANVHPIVTVFGIIIGLNLFGLPGLVFGPLMISYFLICVKLYLKVYSNGAEARR